MIQVKDTRINIVFGLIAFAMIIHFIQNFIPMADRPIYFIGSVIIPIVFLIMMTLFIKESMYFMLIPLIAYFSERLYTLIHLVRFMIFDYVSVFYSASDILNIYLNLIRNTIALSVAVILILAITSKSDKLWRRTHQWSLILLAFHILQLLTLSQYRTDFFGVFLQIPIFMYFSLMVYFLTHRKFYNIYFNQPFAAGSFAPMSSQSGYMSHGSALSQPGYASSSGVSSQPKPASPPKISSQICQNCAANNSIDAQVCHQCGVSLNQSNNIPRTNAQLNPSSPTTKPSSQALSVTCPECNHVNHGSHYCLNCGHSLKTKGNVS
jgi:hypothetical protein